MQWHKRTIIVQKLTTGGGDMSPFVSPLSTITWAHDPTVISSVALRKCPWRFCLHHSDRCRTLMLTCPNSPLWQDCERCSNVLSSSWPPWLTQTWSVEQCGHHVTCALIEMICKLATASWKIQTESVKVSKGSDLEPTTRSVVVTWLFGKYLDINKKRLSLGDVILWLPVLLSMCRYIAAALVYWLVHSKSMSLSNKNGDSWHSCSIRLKALAYRISVIKNCSYYLFHLVFYCS